MDEGLSPDQALEELTGGAFTSLEQFQAQFADGTAPGLEPFLTGLLLAGEAAPELPGLLDLMAGAGDLELLMTLLDGGDGLMALLDGLGGQEGQGAARSF